VREGNLVTRWLITGGCGFIGTALVKNLVQEGGHFIRIVDNLSVGTRKDLSRVCKFTEYLSRVCKFTECNPETHGFKPSHSDNKSPVGSFRSSSVELVVGDILDEELAVGASKDIDIIVHLAANTGVAPSVDNPRSDCMTNILGTFNYLEAARHERVNCFVFASSGAPVGECEPPIHEELAPHPVSPYGASKLAGEAYCSAYFQTFGIKTVVLRFGNVYGPGSMHKTSVVAKFMRQALNGQALEIYGDGSQTRDFIYIDDLVGAIRLTVRKDGIGGEVFQIATFQETTVLELAHLIKAIVEKETNNNIAIIYRGPRPGDVRRNYSDISKARDMFGYEPQFNLSEGLSETFKYFRG